MKHSMILVFNPEKSELKITIGDDTATMVGFQEGKDFHTDDKIFLKTLSSMTQKKLLKALVNNISYYEEPKNLAT